MVFDDMPTNKTGKKPKRIESTDIAKPYWVEMIMDLVDGAGFSYSRIAYRIKVSPSTIQKLATHWNRRPRHVVFHRLLCLHYKVFQGQYVSEKAQEYWEKKQNTSKL